MSLSMRSTVKQKVDKIKSLLTCLLLVHFRGMTIGFYHAVAFYRLAETFLLRAKHIEPRH